MMGSEEILRMESCTSVADAMDRRLVKLQDGVGKGREMRSQDVMVAVCGQDL